MTMVMLPDPVVAVAGSSVEDLDFNDPAFQEALETCGDVLAGFGRPGGRLGPDA